MKQFLTYLFIALFAVSAVSCKKDKDENEKVQLVKSVSPCGYDRTFINYEYDDNNRITTISHSWDNYSFIYKFLYSGNDLVKFECYTYGEIDGEDRDRHFIWNFSKNGNKITVLADDCYSSATIELDNDGYPVKIGDNEVLEYLDGNLVSMSYFDTHYGWDTVTYRYDNKKSPFYYSNTPKWIPIYFYQYTDGNYFLPFAIKNNLTEIHYKTSGNINKITYEYDDNGFATKMYLNGKPFVIFTY